MIAYFVSLPTALACTIIHKLGMNRDKEAVYFLDEPMYRTRGLLSVLDGLTKEKIFKDVVACGLCCPKNLPIHTENDIVKERILEYYDKLLDDSNYRISDFDEIFVINDNWGAEINIYFNLCKIKYVWIEFAKNYLTENPHPTITGCFYSLHEKLKTFSPFAEYAIPCLLKQSDVSQKRLAEKGYTTWDKGECLENILPQDMEKIFSCFNLNEKNFDINNTSKSVMVIRNSNAFYSDGIVYNKANLSLRKEILGYVNCTPNEIFSTADKLCIDFYAPENEKIYIKCHINDPISQEDIFRLYGENAQGLPNVPFEFLSKYIVKRGIKFNLVIGAVSTSLVFLSESSYNKFYALGWHIAKTWWFYISIYTSLLFAKRQGFSCIYCDEVLMSQLELLSEKVGYKGIFLELRINALKELKNSLIIIDMCSYNDFPINKLEKSNTLIFLNYELTDRKLIGSSDMYTPICIKKEKIFDTECDILFRDETLWVYANDIEIKKAARNFVFERNLDNLGMRIYSEKITVPEAVELFRSKQSIKEIEKLNAVIARQEEQISLLTEYIANPNGIKKMLKATDNIYRYLDILQIIKSGYLIVLAVRDTPGDYLPQDIVQKLFHLGFTKFSKELWRMYIGVSIKSAILFNWAGKHPESPVEYLFCSNNIDLDISSKAWRKGNQAAIIINGIDYAVNVRGLNIVVYDVESNQLVDSVGYDAHTEDRRFIRKVI